MAADANRANGRRGEITGIQGRGDGFSSSSRRRAADRATRRSPAHVLFSGVADRRVRGNRSRPAIFGHALAGGATAVAAVRPVPADPAGELHVAGRATCRLFDSSGNRCPTRRPARAQIAAADGGNTTPSSPTRPATPDTLPNFFGTSARAARRGVAALVLQASGGPDSITPTPCARSCRRARSATTSTRTTRGGADGGATITADGTPGLERRESRPRQTTPGSMNEPALLHRELLGPGSIVRLTLTGPGANATGLVDRVAAPAWARLRPWPFSGLPVFDGPARCSIRASRSRSVRRARGSRPAT